MSPTTTAQDVVSINGLTALDLAELRETLREAGIDPDFVSKSTPADDAAFGTRVHEPGTITIVIELAKILIPATTTIIVAWLGQRAQTGKRPPDVKHAGRSVTGLDDVRALLEHSYGARV